MHLAVQKIDVDEEDISILDELARDINVSPISVGLLYLFLGRVSGKMRSDRLDPRAILWEKAVAYITAHPDFQVRSLAAHCNMSESGVYAFFKGYGTTPIELKNKMLVQRAVDLLTTTDLSIEDISARVGFCNAAYFRRQLRRVTGKTPMEIRRESEHI